MVTTEMLIIVDPSIQIISTKIQNLNQLLSEMNYALNLDIPYVDEFLEDKMTVMYSLFKSIYRKMKHHDKMIMREMAY